MPGSPIIVPIHTGYKPLIAMETTTLLLSLALATASLGNIHEEDGPRSHDFRLVNDMKDTIQLSQGYTSCGCTTISFTRDRVLLPRDTAMVRLTFRPMGKADEFQEEATLTYLRLVNGTAQEEHPVRHVDMRLTGFCTPSKETLQKQFPIEISPKVRLSNNRFDLGRMSLGEEKQRTVVALYVKDGMRREVLTVTFRAKNLAKGLQHTEQKARLSTGEEVSVFFDVFIR